MRAEIYWAFGLFLGVVVTAALVNTFSPAFRSRVRRVVVLYGFYVVALATWLGLEAAHSEPWASRFLIVAQLLQAFTTVNVVATIAFAVVLPKTGVSLPTIATDLLVGFGYVLSTLGVLGGHGLNPSSLIASGAVVSAVIAISLQQTLGNILGGVALQLDDSIHEGDWIQLENGRQGKVRSIRWRHTVVETRDWSTMIVPNSQLLAANIMILGKREGRSVPQRMWVWFNVDFRHSPNRVIQVVTDALLASPIDGVATDPKPNCICMDFTRERREAMASYAVRYWLTDLAADDPTSSRVRTRIFAALRRAQIPLALPAITNIIEVDDEQRVAKRTMRNRKERLNALRTVHIFQFLQEEELEQLADGMSHVIYSSNEIITRQGATAHWLYVMTAGTAEVRTNVDPDGSGPLPEEARLVATLKAPDFFGEMGLMTGEPRRADVVAVTDVDCFRLGKETFERVLLARPEIATELSLKLATRRVELLAIREELDEGARSSRVADERVRILGGIKKFFGL